jgi:hypothetical protein
MYYFKLLNEEIRVKEKERERMRKRGRRGRKERKEGRKKERKRKKERAPIICIKVLAKMSFGAGKSTFTLKL